MLYPKAGTQKQAFRPFYTKKTPRPRHPFGTDSIMPILFPELPDEFLSLLNEVLPPAHKDAALVSFTREKPVFFRVNTLRITAEQLQR
jgi:hypothetical protein